jgi:hypothetical protein
MYLFYFINYSNKKTLFLLFIAFVQSRPACSNDDQDIRYLVKAVELVSKFGLKRCQRIFSLLTCKNAAKLVKIVRESKTKQDQVGGSRCCEWHQGLCVWRC